jgi:hypothetical protein
MKKCISNIKLLNWPSRGHNDRQDEPNHRGTNHKTKSVEVVDAFDLVVSLCHQEGLVTFNCSISMSLYLIDPFTANNLLTRLRWYQYPCFIVSKGIDFCSHGSTPEGIRIGLFEAGWFGC